MRFSAILLLAGLGPVSFLFAQTPGGSRVNALLIVDSASTASDREFQEYLADNKARIIHSYAPHAFLGYVPAELDGVLAADYGTTVYRAKIDDMAALSGYGENVSFAVNAWNKRFQEDAPEAPVVTSRVQQAPSNGEALTLIWDEIMKADAYRLQISQDRAFTSVTLETTLARSSFEVYPAFFSSGVYYWRVAGLLTLNTGERREGGFSEASSFTVSKPSRAAAKSPMPAPASSPDARLKSGAVSWAPNPVLKRYRLQISPTADFASPVVDVFTDREIYKLSGLPLARDTTYYMRLMGSDGSSGGTWSGVSEIVLENPGPVLNDVRRPRRRK